MRILTVALILWPSLAFAQIGNSPTNNDDLVSSSRLGQMAKKLSNETSSTASPPPAQAKTLAPSGSQNSTLTSPISNPTPSLSRKSVTSGTHDLSAGQDTSLDIAGTTIGMSPDQVKSILTSKGYTLEDTIKGPSFDELVTIKRDDIRDSRLRSFKGAIRVLKFKKGAFETIEVNFLSMPGHPIAKRVGYRNSDTSLTFEKMRHLLGDKYGDDKYAYETKKVSPYEIQTRGQTEGLWYELNQVTGTGGFQEVRKVKLANQRRFEWFNRSEWYTKDGLYRQSQNLQRILGAILPDDRRSTPDNPKISLILEGERSLPALQDAQIRKQFGATTTTF